MLLFPGETIALAINGSSGQWVKSAGIISLSKLRQSPTDGIQFCMAVQIDRRLGNDSTNPGTHEIVTIVPIATVAPGWSSLPVETSMTLLSLLRDGTEQLLAGEWSVDIVVLGGVVEV